MQQINQKASKVFDALTQGLNRVGDHKKIENGAFMPLSVEVIDKQGLNGGLRISFCHYGEQNGDLMRDPEICFIRVPGINGAGIYAPYYYRNDYLGIEQFAVNFDDNGAVESFYPKMQRDIAVFAGQWAQNLKDQGFIEASKALDARALLSKEVATARELLGNEEIERLETAGMAHEENGALSLHLPEQKNLIEGSAAYNFAKAEGMI